MRKSEWHKETHRTRMAWGKISEELSRGRPSFLFHTSSDTFHRALPKGTATKQCQMKSVDGRKCPSCWIPSCGLLFSNLAQKSSSYSIAFGRKSARRKGGLPGAVDKLLSVTCLESKGFQTYSNSDALLG